MLKRDIFEVKSYRQKSKLGKRGHCVKVCYFMQKTHEKLYRYGDI